MGKYNAIHQRKIKRKQQVKKVFSSICLVNSLLATAQKMQWEEQPWEAINTSVTKVNWDGKEVIQLERDLKTFPFDSANLDATVDGPTFLKLSNLDFENGTIELKLLSQIQENSPFPAARGFIGVAFHIDSTNQHFEAIYLRPSNGRAEDQLRRNHTIQYFSYPDYTYNKLRKEANGIYETYADIGLNEWIDVRIEIHDQKAALYINNQKTPTFLVAKLLGPNINGSIGLWVDIGTKGFFKDLKITKS